jgi:hypothetical protein
MAYCMLGMLLVGCAGAAKMLPLQPKACTVLQRETCTPFTDLQHVARWPTAQSSDIEVAKLVPSFSKGSSSCFWAADINRNASGVLLKPTVDASLAVATVKDATSTSYTKDSRLAAVIGSNAAEDTIVIPDGMEMSAVYLDLLTTVSRAGAAERRLRPVTFALHENHGGRAVPPLPPPSPSEPLVTSLRELLHLD